MSQESKTLALLLTRSRNRQHSAVLILVLMVFPSWMALAFKFPRFEVTCFLFACASIALAWGFWLRACAVQKTLDAIDP
jgi:hypothetical protein